MHINQHFEQSYTIPSLFSYLHFKIAQILLNYGCIKILEIVIFIERANSLHDWPSLRTSRRSRHYLLPIVRLSHTGQANLVAWHFSLSHSGQRILPLSHTWNIYHLCQIYRRNLAYFTNISQIFIKQFYQWWCEWHHCYILRTLSDLRLCIDIWCFLALNLLAHVEKYNWLDSSQILLHINIKVFDFSFLNV